MKITGWRRELARGARIPRAYGIAWFDRSKCLLICYPWPLSWLARHWRTASWRARRAVRALTGPGADAHEVAHRNWVHKYRQTLADHFTSGYLTGWQECYDACRAAIEEELDQVTSGELEDEEECDSLAGDPLYSIEKTARQKPN